MVDRSKIVSQNGFFSNSSGNATNIADSLANVTVGFEQLSVGQTAKALTSAHRSFAAKAMISIDNEDIRVRTDGQDPTKDIGLTIMHGDILVLEGNSEILNFKAISKSLVNSAILNVEYKN